jgi:hypothetical protein
MDGTADSVGIELGWPDILGTSDGALLNDDGSAEKDGNAEGCQDGFKEG